MSADIGRLELCVNCGRGRAEHYLANYADGPHISLPFLVCQNATFQADTPIAAVEALTEDKK